MSYMSGFKTIKIPRSVQWLAGIGMMLIATLAYADSNTVAANSQTFAPQYLSYGKVEPIMVLKLKAARTGVVTGIKILPGDKVKSGTLLGRLTGPTVDGLISQRMAEVEDAEAAVTAAKKILSIERQKLIERLGTQKAVDQAEADLTKANARLANAKSQLKDTRASLVLEAPMDGAVIGIDAGNGEQVKEGQTVLTLQPAEGLWLKAKFYGSDVAAIHVGMTGQFEPADGSATIPVRVRSVIGPVEKDGGQTIGLVATLPTAKWQNGEAGKVLLEGPEQTYAAVPTRALILDKGRWWVLVKTKRGNEPREVVPGPAHGESTLITRGIEPGMEVVVENAYLEFHKNISIHYQPPD